MDKIIRVSDGQHYTAITVGKLDQLVMHSLIHPKSGQKVEGKVFLKEVTQATGTEISFQLLPARTALPYFHIHRKNEETYIFLKGEGEFQVDENTFPIAEGSIIRVAPSGKRGLRNKSDEDMIYIVIQSKEHSLEEYSTSDGERIPHIPSWEK